MLLALAAATVGLSFPPVPATGSGLLGERLEAFALARAAVARHPAVQVATWTDAIDVRLHDGLIVAGPAEGGPLVEHSGRIRLLIADEPDVFVDGMWRPEGGSTAGAMTFISRRIGPHRSAGEGHDLIVAYTHLFVGPDFGRVNLARDAQHLEGSSNVTLIQDVASGEPDVLHLQVQAVDADFDVVVRIDLRAESAEDLQNRHPEVFDTWVRPMFVDVGFGHAIDGQTRRTAVGVFLAELPFDEATERAVRGRIARLDSDDFVERRRAQTELEASDRAAASVLALADAGRLDGVDLSPEQRARVEAVLGRWKPADAGTLRHDENFLRRVKLLTGGPDDANLRQLAADSLK